jgi:hypothetical protein
VRSDLESADKDDLEKASSEENEKLKQELKNKEDDDFFTCQNIEMNYKIDTPA